MSEMIVQVRNKILRRIGGVNHFVSHNKDYTIQFQFDESWNNVRTKMAVFAYEDGEYGSEIFDGDTCNVPEFPREGRILIGVKAGEDLSTELLCIPVCKSADDVITDEYDEPDPKIYEQILDIINNLWNGGTTVYPSPVKFLASPSAAKVGDLIRVKEVDENGDVTRTEGFDVGVELEKKINAPQVAQVGEVLTVEEVDADGKPKKWKTAPAAAEQKQADWAQNDETAADYVKNRPFYSEKTKVTAVDAHVDTPLSTQDGLSAYLIPEESINYEYLDEGLLFIDGETYDVYLDSSLYRLQAKIAGDSIILGNAYILLGTGEDTGEPFAVGVIQGLGGLVIITNTGSHDLAIKLDWTIVHKIDGMYYDKSLIFGSNEDGIVPDSIFVQSQVGSHKIGELYWVRQYDEDEGVYTEHLAAYGLNYAVRGYYLYDINNPTLVTLPTNVGDKMGFHINGDRNKYIGDTDANLNIINLKIKENNTTSDSISLSFINQSLKDGSVTYSTVFYRDGKLYGVEIHGDSIVLKRLI